MARSKKNEEDKLVNIGVKVPLDLKSELDAGAKAYEIPVGTYARQLIRAGLRARGDDRANVLPLDSLQQKMITAFSRLTLGRKKLAIIMMEAFEKMSESEISLNDVYLEEDAPQQPIRRERTAADLAEDARKLNEMERQRLEKIKEKERAEDRSIPATTSHEKKIS